MLRITLTVDEHAELMRLNRAIGNQTTALQLPDNVKPLTGKVFAEKAMHHYLEQLGKKYGYAPQTAKISSAALWFDAAPNMELGRAISAVVGGIMGGLFSTNLEKPPMWIIEGLIVVGLLEAKPQDNGELELRTTAMGEVMKQQAVYAQAMMQEAAALQNAANEPAIQ